MYLINGQSTERLAVNDRGVQFGDGCFTTARIAAGEIALFSVIWLAWKKRALVWQSPLTIGMY